MGQVTKNIKKYIYSQFYLLLRAHKMTKLCVVSSMLQSFSQIWQAKLG
jgi:hypothetical protein